ncbi:SDR family oxidoreductase [Streptomyces sp. NPDC049099]|uniref:SDR family oxidoreductase n=1 Tax=Streptomyces sp. NPDC049099 TaxID=3155768 RepID=UPI00343C3E8C
MRERTALVLGGTSGIGLGIARRLAADGARVTVASRDPDRAARTARDLRSALPDAAVSGIGLDLGRPETIRDALRAHGDRDGPAGGGAFDVVVLNGPGHRPGPVTEATPEDFADAYRTMFLSLKQVVDSVVDGMRARRWGRLLYVSSSSVVTPLDELAVSSVVRAAVQTYLKLLANALAADGITVNSVVPGRIDTPRVRTVDAARATARGVAAEQVRGEAERRIPAGRYGTPEEVGELAAFLCSERAGYVTGSAFRCDGGMIAAV